MALREFPGLGESTALVRRGLGDIRTFSRSRPSALRGALGPSVSGSGLDPEVCLCAEEHGVSCVECLRRMEYEYGVVLRRGWRRSLSPDINPD